MRDLYLFEEARTNVTDYAEICERKAVPISKANSPNLRACVEKKLAAFSTWVALLKKMRADWPTDRNLARTDRRGNGDGMPVKNE